MRFGWKTKKLLKQLAATQVFQPNWISAEQLIQLYPKLAADLRESLHLNRILSFTKDITRCGPHTTQTCLKSGPLDKFSPVADFQLIIPCWPWPVTCYAGKKWLSLLNCMISTRPARRNWCLRSACPPLSDTMPTLHFLLINLLHLFMWLLRCSYIRFDNVDDYYYHTVVVFLALIELKWKTFSSTETGARCEILAILPFTCTVQLQCLLKCQKGEVALCHSKWPSQRLWKESGKASSSGDSL